MTVATNRWGLAVDPEHPHLGGYVPGGDPASFYPEMWDALISGGKVRWMLDVGCGEGQAIDFFREQGVEAWGVDGIGSAHPGIQQWDFNQGPCELLPMQVDLVWCCEFVEHIEERHLPNVLAAFKRGRMVLMTHAEPWQPGHHHVNCRLPDYWIGALAAIGFEHDVELTEETRHLASQNTHPDNYYVKTGLAFRRLA